MIPQGPYVIDPKASVKAAAEKVEDLLAAERLDDARAMIEDELKRCNHVRLWRLLKRVLLIEGNEAAARAVMREIVGLIHSPTNVELALAGVAQSAATLLQHYKILYQHVPKCGSTSVKDMLTYLISGERGGGESHVLMSERAPYRIVAHADYRTKLADWFRFLIVRDPIERIRSYYRFNIVLSDDLGRLMPGRDSYFGLAFKPDYPTFLRSFQRYRQIFPTVRAHTISLVEAAGGEPDLYSWVGTVADMADLRTRLSAWTGVDLPAVHNFPSQGQVDMELDPRLEDEIRAFYTADYDTYGRWF